MSAKTKITHSLQMSLKDDIWGRGDSETWQYLNFNMYEEIWINYPEAKRPLGLLSQKENDWVVDSTLP